MISVTISDILSKKCIELPIHHFSFLFYYFRRGKDQRLEEKLYLFEERKKNTCNHKSMAYLQYFLGKDYKQSHHDPTTRFNRHSLYIECNLCITYSGSTFLSTCLVPFISSRWCTYIVSLMYGIHTKSKPSMVLDNIWYDTLNIKFINIEN